MKINQPLIRSLLLITSSLLATSQLHAQISIAQGYLYVFQTGDGTNAAASGVGAPAFIDQFSTSQGPSGGTLNSFLAQTALPTTPASFGGNFLSVGQSQQNGQLSYDAAANVLVFGGYSGRPVNASINNPAANRDIGQVNSSGNFSFAAQNSTAYGGNNTSGGLLRGAVTDGSGNYWASGNANAGGLQGIWYYGGGTPAALTGTGVASRGIGLYGGNLFYTTGSGTAGLYMITGMPTSGTQTPSLLFASGGTPYGFDLSPDLLTAYIANEAGGIIKATYSGIFSGGAYSGGTWTTTTLDSATAFAWLDVDYTGANPTIFATTLASSTGNKLVKIVDTGVANPTILTLDTITGTSSASGNYDGVVFIPAAVPEPSLYGLTALGLLLVFPKSRRTRKA